MCCLSKGSLTVRHYFSSLFGYVECNKNKCNQAYIGETCRSFEKRVSEHLGYARTKDLEKITGAHFNSPGHSIAHMKFSIIEKIKNHDQLYRKMSHY